MQNTPTEWSYRTTKEYSDPFNELELDVLFTLPTGQEQKVPTFWAGGSEWRVRYSPPVPGDYKFRTICTDVSNNDLHGISGTLTVTPHSGADSLYRHGSIRVAKDKRHFEHADGKPFFWLGDTWWMGLCNRLSWPDGFETLTSDRVQKGFTIVQIVAGLYPDMPPFDPRGANEAGFPWQKNFSSINPAYFDMADIRIRHLADAGLVSCVVGFWGFFIPFMGLAKVKQHWRYLIARWGAYPVVWCLAGEGTMPYYRSETPEQDEKMQKHVLSELSTYVRAIDPYKHAITIHPPSSARSCVEDPSVLDFDMLQTGHSSWQSVPNTIQTFQSSYAASPTMPTLIGEVCYEGIMQSSREEIQRFLFWSAMLSGAGGHTYGANGIWQVNTRQVPYGLSPGGYSWGGPAWEIAAQLPGSGQLGLGKKLLSRYSWWKLEPRPNLVEPHWGNTEYWLPFAAEIPGEALIAFYPAFTGADVLSQLRFNHLPSATYKAFFFDPSDGTETMLGNVVPDVAGNWSAPAGPTFRDWLIVLEQTH